MPKATNPNKFWDKFYPLRDSKKPELGVLSLDELREQLGGSAHAGIIKARRALMNFVETVKQRNFERIGKQTLIDNGLYGQFKNREKYGLTMDDLRRLAGIPPKSPSKGEAAARIAQIQRNAGQQVLARELRAIPNGYALYNAILAAGGMDELRHSIGEQPYQKTGQRSLSIKDNLLNELLQIHLATGKYPSTYRLKTTGRGDLYNAIPLHGGAEQVREAFYEQKGNALRLISTLSRYAKAKEDDKSGDWLVETIIKKHGKISKKTTAFDKTLLTAFNFAQLAGTGKKQIIKQIVQGKLEISTKPGEGNLVPLHQLKYYPKSTATISQKITEYSDLLTAVKMALAHTKAKGTAKPETLEAIGNLSSKLETSLKSLLALKKMLDRH